MYPIARRHHRPYNRRMMLFLRKKGFQRSARLALFAMLLQVLLPLWHHPANALAPNGAHICSVFRFAADHADPGKAPATKSSCPICFSLHLLGGGFVPPADGMIAVAFQEPGDFIFHAEAGPPHFEVWPGLRSRAPPFLA